MLINISFDPTKDGTNQRKHGIPLSDAVALEWDTLVCKQDTRKDYGELRMIGYAMGGDRLFCVVFVDRPPQAPRERRIISLRKANNREITNYVHQASDNT